MNRLRVILRTLCAWLAVFSCSGTLGFAQNPATRPDDQKVVPATFKDVTTQVGVHFRQLASHTSKKYLVETMGSGVALFDYDNDGRLDIFLVNEAPLNESMPKYAIPQKTGPEYWNRLYHQKSDGTFEDVTEKAGLQGVGYGMGVAVGDYDNDGYEDLYVTAYGGNRLYHNNGDGTFSDVTEKAGVAGSGWSTSAAWVDLDNDGLLDLIVLRYLKWDFSDIFCGEHRAGYRAYCHPDLFQPISPLVYHNDGNGHFSDIANKTGLSVPGKGLGISLADYDRDGHIDIFIANDSMPEFLFHNKGNGTFEEVGLGSEVAVDGDGHTYAGMGADFVDYDNDGLPDLLITDLAGQKYALYRNLGHGDFAYATDSSDLGRLTRMHSGWGVQFLDYDNDGWKDILISQGHDLDTISLQAPQFHYREPMLLLRNHAGRFIDVSQLSGDFFKQPLVARGLAAGDIDNDGRTDAVVMTNDGAAYVLRNETSTKSHWLTLKLVGHRSNRDAIGAEVELTGAEGKQFETVTTAGSYLSSSDKRVHLGLGSEDVARSIKIRWPSGIMQTLTNVRCDQILQVDEPSESLPGSAAQKP